MDKPTSNIAANPSESIVKRLLKKGGLRARINANCCDCIYDDLEPGTWRKQVENCTVSDCALYNVRPKSLSKNKNTNNN